MDQYRELFDPDLGALLDGVLATAVLRHLTPISFHDNKIECWKWSVGGGWGGGTMWPNS
jgi:hypothetical protein